MLFLFYISPRETDFDVESVFTLTKNKDDDENEEIPEEEETYEIIDVFNLNEIIHKVRKSISFIRKSAGRRNDYKKLLKDNGENEVIPQLDCKVRWNSLIPMVTQFLKHKDYIALFLAKNK